MATRESITAALTMLTILWACSTEQDASTTAELAGGSPVTSQEDAQDMAEWTARKKLLHSLQTNLILPAYESFLASSIALEEASETWAANQTEDNLEGVKSAWRSTMADWQAAELFQLGPAGAAERRIGGLDFRDRIYSFPVVNSCRVDQELVRGGFQAPDWVGNAQFNVRGLDAIEYLVFGLEVENSCPPVSGINRNGEWTALAATPDALLTQRAAYVFALAQGVTADARVLVESWGSNPDSFGRAFVDASAPFSSEREAVDQVFAAMYYVDKFIKDLKLGKPAGITDECMNAMCPESVESKWSANSKANLLKNVQTLKLFFTGGASDDAFGFDDLLEEEGATALAERMTQKLDDALTAIEALDTSVEAQLSLDIDVVFRAHAAIRDFTDDLKTQFVTVLNLSVPQEGAGDND